MKCLLCQNNTVAFKNINDREYFKCVNCHSIMLDQKNYVSSEKEKERYEEHNNDVFDKRYQAFVWPIVEAVLKDYNKEHKGLDFGSGTGPVITKLLEDKDYSIKVYDPYFANFKEKLADSYDYIVCCEVMEHFYDPRLEFKRLRSMLNPEGSLYLKTSIYDESIDFDAWYYKNDQTHVFFYHKKALDYIKKEYDFSDMTISNNMIIYRNR